MCVSPSDYMSRVLPFPLTTRRSPAIFLHCQGIKSTQVRTFYTMPEYESWKDSLGGSTKGWRIKYYKGLGTSTSAEAKEYFAAIDRHRKQFVWNGGFVSVE